MNISAENIAPFEKSIVGRWVLMGNRVVADANCDRIEKLTSNILVKIAVDPLGGGWITLYRDPVDGRFWEKSYDDSGAHGGGAPKLINLNEDQVRLKYGGVGVVVESLAKRDE